MRITTYIIQIMIITMMMTQVLVSCTAAPPTSTLASKNDSQDDKDDKKNDDKDDKNDGEVCRDINSCEDICDDMFRDDKSAALACGRLDEEQVDRISDVSDIFLTDRVIRTRDLEEVKAGDLKQYLDIGVSQLLHIFKGEATDRDDDVAFWELTPTNRLAGNSQVILEWILTNDNIAQEFLDHDTKNELARQLFSNLGSAAHGGEKSFLVGISDESVLLYASANPEEISFLNVDDDTDQEIDLRDIDKSNTEKINFFIGFTQVEIEGAIDDIFMIEALDEDETTAIKWAHKAAVSYCREGADTNDDDDIEVKYCLQAIYCALRSQKTDSESWNFFDPDINLIKTALDSSSVTIALLVGDNPLGVSPAPSPVLTPGAQITAAIALINDNDGDTGSDSDADQELVTAFVTYVRDLSSAPTDNNEIIADFLLDEDEGGKDVTEAAPKDNNDRVFEDLKSNKSIFGNTDEETCSDFSNNSDFGRLWESKS